MGMANKAKRAVKACIARNRQPVRLPRLSIVTPVGPRKDKIRARARTAAPSQWHCRPTGRTLRPVQDVTERARWADQEAAERREMIAAAQGRHCALCGHLVTDERGSIDHCDPLSTGGDELWGNYLFAHRLCNARKGNDEPTGCEIVWLFAVNARLDLNPVQW